MSEKKQECVQRKSKISEHTNKDVCIFCKIAKGELPAKKIYENDNFFSIPDANPAVGGHSLVVSKKHFANLLEMPSSLGTELLNCIKNTAIRIIDEQKADGFNVFSNNGKAAGQVVNHIHFHIIPRKKDDGLKMIVWYYLFCFFVLFFEEYK